MGSSVKEPTSEKNLRRNLARLGFLWAALVAAGLIALRGSRWLLPFELDTLDARFHLRGERPASPEHDILIVALDENSLRRLGHYPWPRRIHAQLIERLRQDAPRAIVFDIFFVEPSTPEDDEYLARAMALAGNVFLAGFSTPLATEPTPQQQILLPRFTFSATLPPQNALWHYPHVALPLPPLMAVARGLGLVDIAADVDSVYRHATLLAVYRNRLFPSLPLAVAAYTFGVPLSSLSFTAQGALKVGPVQVPLNRAGRLLINYRGRSGMFPRYSYVDVLEGQYPPGTFTHKIVLIGATAKGLGDIRPTPFDPLFHAVEINASILDNLLRSDFLRVASTPLNLLIILGLCLLPGLYLPRLPLGVGLLLTFALLGSYTYICFSSFLHRQLYLDFFPPVLGLGLTYLGLTTYRLFTLERHQRFLRRMFEFYVSPEVMRRILEHPTEDLKPGGERREVTVLFADIVGFTAISQRLAPETLVEIMNEFFTVMGDILFKYEGYIDKFLGDGIMAVFNVFPPVGYRDHALRAVKAALEMQERLEKMNRRWEREGRPTFRLAIGLNTGPAVVGNIGSEKLFHYSVIGDAVNLAARLQVLCRDYGASILIGEETYRQVQEVVAVGQRHTALVRGRETPVTFYEVRGLKMEPL